MITVATFKWVMKLLLALVVFLLGILFVAIVTTQEDRKEKESDEQKKIDALIERQDKDVELDKED